MLKNFVLLAVALFVLGNILFVQEALAQKNTKNTQKVGEEEENSYQAYLQETTVVLKPYEHSVSLLFGYGRSQSRNFYNIKIIYVLENICLDKFNC
ncbi:MAG: hypothetical protein GXP44_03440 [bacterium]|nr:hypothetical protein [bacterium]